MPSSEHQSSNFLSGAPDRERSSDAESSTHHAAATSGLSQAAARYLQCFESLSPQTLDPLAACFAGNARFRDPFNDVRGREAVRHVFAHGFEACAEMQFEIVAAAERDRTLFAEWICRYRLRRFQPQKERRIEGASRIRLREDGQVAEHVDYWDPAQWVYADVPVLNLILGWLRGRLQA